MTKQLKWRLGKLPTPEEVSNLVNDKIITKEEARDILFNEVEEKEQSIDDAKKEIKFLKELVEKLANKSQIIESIRYIEKPYYNYGWYNPYQVWCSTYVSTANSLAGTPTTSYNSNVLSSYSGVSGQVSAYEPTPEIPFSLIV